MTTAIQRWLFLGVLLWAIGCLAVEAVASLGVAMVFIGVVADLSIRRPRPEVGLMRWWPLLAFAAWAVLAPALAGRPPSGTGVARLADWLAIPFGAHALSRLNSSQRKAACAVVSVTFLLSCALAAFQHFGAWPAPETFAGLEWTRYPFYRVYEPVPNAPGRFMAGGLLSHRLKFAHVGGIACLFALCLGLRAVGGWRLFGLGTALAGGVAILWFPYARMASAALLVSAVVAAGLSHPQPRRAVALSAVLVGITALSMGAYAPVRERFLSALTFSGSGERAELWATGVRAVRQFPLVGCGLGRFRPEKFRVETTSDLVRQNPGKAHNQVLSMAAEVGIPGALLFLLLLSSLMRRMDPRTPSGAAGLSVGIFFVQLSLGHDPLYQAPFSMALALAFSAALSLSPTDPTAVPRVPLQPVR